MKHLSLTIFSTLAMLCMLALLAATAVWMYVPFRVIYQESSQVQTGVYSVEVRQHGHSYFVTPDQKYLLDLIHSYTAPIWFSGFGYLFLFTAFGGFARLRLLQRRTSVAGGSP